MERVIFLGQQRGPAGASPQEEDVDRVFAFAQVVGGGESVEDPASGLFRATPGIREDENCSFHSE